MKKLLYIHNTPIDSETANIIQVLYMCNSFSRLGLDVTLALPESKKDIGDKELGEFVKGKINQVLSFRIVTFPRPKILRKFHTLGSYFGAKKVFDRNGYDICFIRVPLFLELAMNSGIPTIYEAHHTLLHDRYCLMHKFWKARLINHSKKKNLFLFITISQALADHWVNNGVPENKVKSLHDGFDAEFFMDIKSIKSSKKDLNIPSSQKVITYTGSLYEDRGIENILKLATDFPQCLFFVLGGPSGRKDHFDKLTEELKLKNIFFLGWNPRDQVKRYLSASDVLLMIWSREVKTINFCSPLKMFEYMAAGRIIVGHLFPTIIEVLTDGENAHLADPDSYEDLRMKLDEALSNHYPSKLAQNARQLAFEKYSWDKRAESIHRFFSLLKR